MNNAKTYVCMYVCKFKSMYSVYTYIYMYVCICCILKCTYIQYTTYVIMQRRMYVLYICIVCMYELLPLRISGTGQA